jgi:hypothetical protein
MAKKPEASPDDLMKPAAIRSLLSMVKKDGEKEISAAIALTEDKEGVIMLEKKMKPKKLRSHMIAEAKDAGLSLAMSSIRFGKATTKDDDATILLMKVNKDVSGAGLPAAIKKRVKLAGFSDVIFSVDEALDAESEDETSETEGQEQMAGTAPPPPPPPPQKAPAPPVDLAALTQRLAGLIKRIPGAAPGIQPELGGLAKQANVLLKTGSPNEAVKKMDELEQKLGPSATDGKPTPVTASEATLTKSRDVWSAAQQKIVAEVEALKKAVAAAFQGDAHETAVTTALGQLDDIPKHLDTSLLGVIEEVMKEQDPEKRAVSMQQAQQIVAGYEQFMTGSAVFPKLAGATPFGLNLTIAPTATATLKALQAGLR